jgi:two-component system, NarL family, response regulator DevR
MLTLPGTLRPKRLLIVDRLPLFRRGVADAIAPLVTVSLVGEAGSAPAAVSQMRNLRAEIVVLDAGLGGQGGIESVVATGLELGSRLLLVGSVITPLPEGLLDHPAIGGAVHRSEAATETLKALSAIAAGGSHVSPGILALPGSNVFVPPITARQRLLLELVAEGLPNTVIATRLSLSVSSINAELSMVLRALGASDRTQAVLLAIEAGLIPPFTVRWGSNRRGVPSRA